MKVVISSGHGMFVAGAIGIINEVTEARRVTDMVAQYLHLIGVDVDVFHENTATNQRDNINAIIKHHNGKRRDLDVSVHFNAFKPTNAPRGVEVLYRNEKALADRVSSAIASSSGLRNRGGKHRTDLGFLNNTNKPAILIEVCFVDSEEDVRIYRKYFDEICRSIAESISGQSISQQLPITEQPVQECLENFKISEENIRAMKVMGVINSPDYWRSVNVEWLDQLLSNAGWVGVLDKRIDNGITNISSAFDVLQDAGIMSSPDYWRNLVLEQSVLYLDQLLINLANRCRIVLEKIISAEARSEDLKGQILIGNVILNRHNRVDFPNGIYNVVFERNINTQGVSIQQFSPVVNGAYAKAVPSQLTKQAVEEVLAGVDYSEGALFFRSIKGLNGSWHEQTLTHLFTHGGHAFFI